MFSTDAPVILARARTPPPWPIVFLTPPPLGFFFAGSFLVGPLLGTRRGPAWVPSEGGGPAGAPPDTCRRRFRGATPRRAAVTIRLPRRQFAYRGGKSLAAAVANCLPRRQIGYRGGDSLTAAGNRLSRREIAYRSGESLAAAGNRLPRRRQIAYRRKCVVVGGII